MRKVFNMAAADEVGLTEQGLEFVHRFEVEVEEVAFGTLQGELFYGHIVLEGEEVQFGLMQTKFPDIGHLNPSFSDLELRKLRLTGDTSTLFVFDGLGPFSGESLCDFSKAFRAAGFSIDKCETVSEVGSFVAIRHYHVYCLFQVNGEPSLEWVENRFNTLAAQGWNFDVRVALDGDDGMAMRLEAA